jgi:hypothetical protein
MNKQENNKPIKIEYDELIDIVSKGILQNNESLFKGITLIKSQAPIPERIDEQIDVIVQGIAYSVVSSLKKRFKEQLIITEEGKEIMDGE